MSVRLKDLTVVEQLVLAFSLVAAATAKTSRRVCAAAHGR